MNDVTGIVDRAELPPSAQLPDDFDPLAEGILMAHQRAWLEDHADLKLCEKGRRTGITFAEALDDTLIAATKRSEGGQNVFYIGDTREKGLEFIGYCAHFARVVAKELVQIEEFLFEDRLPSGESRQINAYRIRFASGLRINALASRPASIRGLQGIVVIDEAAFHLHVAEVIAAANALLIWGGKIRIISTHNGVDNAFNLLAAEVRAGKWPYSLHRYTFDDAVRNGLYERVCLMKGERATAEDKQRWRELIIASYGTDNEARNEELFCVPRRGSGAYFTRLILERCMADDIPVLRFVQPAEFVTRADRKDVAAKWIKDVLRPVLDSLPTTGRTVLGQDFGRDGDLSIIVVLREESPTLWPTALLLELRRIPFDVQQQILFAVIDGLPLFHHAKFDARGNGQSHAEAALQKYHAQRVECVMATVAWYAENFPRYRAAVEDCSIVLPRSEDVIADHRRVILEKGNPKVDDGRDRGSDGEYRHGDSAVAYVLAWAATRQEGQPQAGDTVEAREEESPPESFAGRPRARMFERIRA